MNPAAKISPLVRMLFVNDSITARMLRYLLRSGPMLQADFMREYHRRCERARPSVSSFGNNFGRFVAPVGFNWYVPPSRATGIPEGHRGVPALIRQVRGAPRTRKTMLEWNGPDLETILANMTPQELDASFASLERQITNQRDSDDDKETVWWAVTLRDAKPGGNMNMHENPPWLTKAVAGSFEELEGKVKPAWLPRLEDVRAVRGGIAGKIHELGCGAYGCVLPTLDPKVVLKATTDTTEAQFAESLARTLIVPVTVAYHQVTSLPAKRGGRRIYLLWREEAKDVGKISGRAADAINVQHELAQAAFDLIHADPKSEQLPGALDAWVDSLHQMAAVREIAYLGDGMLAVYEQQHVFFGDIHPGNVGRCMREGKLEWVITDPGHVAVVGGTPRAKGARKNPARSQADAMSFARRLLLDEPDPDGMSVAFDALAEAGVSLVEFTQDAHPHVELQKADLEGDDATGRIKLNDDMQVEWYVQCSKMPGASRCNNCRRPLTLSHGVYYDDEGNDTCDRTNDDGHVASGRGGKRNEFDIYWAASFPFTDAPSVRATLGGVSLDILDPFANDPIRTRANRPFAIAHAARLAWEMAREVKEARYENITPDWMKARLVRLARAASKSIPKKYDRDGSRR